MRQLHDEPDELRDRMVARAQEVAETLEGTARDLNDESTEEERSNKDFTDTLDAAIFECLTCNWWCELSEQNSCGACDDCCLHAQEDMECILTEDDEDDDEEDEDGEDRGYN